MRDRVEPDRDKTDERGEPVAPADPAGANDTRAGATAELGDDAAGEPTERRAPVSAPSPQRDAGEPARLGDVARTTGSFLRGRLAALVALVRAHRAAATVIVVAVVALAVAGAASLAAGPDLPSAETVSEDALRLVRAPAYEGGDFGWDDVLVAREAEVRSVSASGDPDRASAEVHVTFSGKVMTAEKVATIDYVRSDGSWAPEGAARDERVSWDTGTGVDADKVVANVGAVLERADAELGYDPDDGPSLARLYAGAQVSVDAQAYDPEGPTSSVELTCSTGDAFQAYTCHLSVAFGFRSASGSWEIEDVSVAEGALSRSLEPLAGTWEGTFQSQQTEGAKCLAGRGAGLAVTIDAASAEGGSTLTGTVSGLAHYHAHPADDAASCEGDTPFEDEPFSATVTDDDGSLVLEATLPEDVGGTVSIELRFGTKDDPTAVTAVVTTTYPHTGSFLFIPYDETLTYADSFALRRAG